MRALALFVTVAACAATLHSGELKAQDVTGPETAGQLEPIRTPAAIVASRIRQVLEEHASGADLAATTRSTEENSSGADLAATTLSTPVAPPRVAPPPEVGPSPVRVAVERASALVALVPMERGIGLLAQMLAIVVAVYALSMLLRTVYTRLGRRAEEPVPGRLEQVQSLAEGGLSTFEISRRTGIAQDAIPVLMSRSGS